MSTVSATTDGGRRGVERHDAVVIGAGPNGLAAAIRLAEAGRSVLVLEAQPTPGGAVRTAELTLPGFRHDVFSAVHPAGAASPVFGRMPLAEHGLEWVHPEVALAHPLPDGSAGALHRDLDVTAAGLDGLHAGDGTSWAALARPYVDRFDALRRVLLSGFPPVVGGARLLAAIGLAETLEFARLALMPAEALAAERFAGPHARALLLGSVLHADVAPNSAGSAITGLYLNLMAHAVGWPSPRGGAQGLTDALIGHLRSLGGEVRCATRVARVEVQGGRIAGVAVESGSLVRTRLVIADVTPPGLVRLAGDALDPSYRQRLGRFRFGPATVKVDWALDGPVAWTAPVVRGAGTVHVGGEPEALNAMFRALHAGEVPERPFVLFGQQSLADPTRAPAGKQTAWGYSRVPRGVAVDVEAHAERMEAQIERFAPGFRDLVLARHVLGPRALEERDANLSEGDVGGGTYELDQLLFRPVPSLAPYRTPVRGLYIGSASTFPGGAVHGVPGWTAAGYALAESRLRRFW